MISVSQKLDKLRQLMRQHNVDYYYVPATDAHNNEYLPPAWRRRAWISHFTGSAGDVLVGQDRAYLWTDFRYTLQAQNQLDNNFELFSYPQATVAPITVWLQQNATKKNIGIDPKLISIKSAERWRKILSAVNGKLVLLENNLIDAIWEDQPAIVTHPIRSFNIQYSGRYAKNKIEDVRQFMRQHHIDAHVITMLDAVAWLYNIRGNDIDYNPLVISYAVITLDKALLFADLSQISQEVKAYLAEQGISILPYISFKYTLNKLQGNVLLDPNTTNLWVSNQLKQATPVFLSSPISLLKACKNSTEIKGMHEAHRLDAIALCKFFHWLENHWHNLTELEAAQRLSEFRLENPHCQGLSFETISAFAEHGAIIHYCVTKETNRTIDDRNLYLIDSGGQYLEGTTDITRTIHLGQPTQQQKQCYTLVLKGHLALRHTLFPNGTNGEHLNAIAHRPLWNEGLDYNHGTGHGVGCYLCVHEGPQRIATTLTGVPLKAGMIVSNEPGLYIENQYGIRIENLCVIVETLQTNKSLPGYGPFYGFEDLTKVPYARHLIDKSMLASQEIQWINDYHREIYECLHNDLPTKVRQWLKKATLPL